MKNYNEELDDRVDFLFNHIDDSWNESLEDTKEFFKNYPVPIVKKLMDMGYDLVELNQMTEQEMMDLLEQGEDEKIEEEPYDEESNKIVLTESEINIIGNMVQKRITEQEMNEKAKKMKKIKIGNKVIKHDYNKK